MHLLYLDESGHEKDPNTNFFVMAGFAIFERSTHWLESQISPIAERFNAIDPGSVEFHGSPMFNGKDEWKSFAPADRVQATVDILSLLANQQLGIRVFASVIETSTMPAHQILERSYEAVAHQFDSYLAWMWSKYKNPQRGLVICDKASYEMRLQNLSTLFKHSGHSQGKLRNFAEVPLFLDSKASRLIQMADLIAYWIFRFYQSKDDRGYRLIEPHIYRQGPEQVGLVTAVTPQTVAAMQGPFVHKWPFPQRTGTELVAANATPEVV
ncbi:DUF3800 domain-containing protein [Pseudomonas putida]|uniref:DUF3800 domain-containing protein n=1 Tax=Pseudomonas putida TaxID=303 RepID=UPI002B248FC2|nr:DUF3800 domain-containing protein [Pseudomonas putida]